MVLVCLEKFYLLGSTVKIIFSFSIFVIKIKTACCSSFFVVYFIKDLDSNLKIWRFCAVFLNDLVTSLYLTALFLKHLLLTWTRLSYLCHLIVGLPGGLTRAALPQYQAEAHTMVDLLAKEGSQETIVNLLALFDSIFLLDRIKHDILLV